MPLTRHRPALIAAIRDESGLIAIHRIFLDGDAGGLPEAADRRAGLGAFAGGAVRLGGTGPRVGLAEGIETALSVSALFGVTCWATLGTGRFGSIALPSAVEELMLFLDHDEGGRRAETLARRAFADIRISVHVPPREGDDWNDVLRGRAAASID